LIRTARDAGITLNICPFPGFDLLAEKVNRARSLVLILRCGGAEFFGLHRLAANGVACLAIGINPDLIAAEVSAGLVKVAPEGPQALQSALTGLLREGWASRDAPNPASKIGDGGLSGWEDWASGLLGRTMTMPRIVTLLEHPLVTVVVPHFERTHLLLQTIEGFVRQTYPQIEIIVVDDGSRRADSRQALAAVEGLLEGRNGKVVRQENAYLGAARNTGFSHARGDFVLFFDDDDYPVPQMVEQMMRAIEARRADIVSCGISYWDGNSLPASFDELKCSSNWVGACPSLAFWRNGFGSAAVLVRRGAGVKAIEGTYIQVEALSY
jgi:hypothetical protein